VLLAGDRNLELELNVDDDAVQLFNLLLERLKVLLLTVVLPVNSLSPTL
jgi:hypothetical protein